MRIEEALVTYLTAHTGVKNIIGKRLYAFHAPANVTFPFITYQRVSTERFLSHDEPVNDLATIRVQFDIFATTYAGALALLDELRDAMQGYQGTMSSMVVQAVLPALEQHLDMPDMDYYRVTIDYRISHTEE